MPHRMDLEAPYQDAAAREERYTEIENQKRAELWEALRDEQEGEQFIDNWLADPNYLLAEFFREVAEARAKVAGVNHRTAEPQTIIFKAYEHLFFKAEMMIEKHVEKVAEIKAQAIYEDR